jgi:hypothetical protein
MFQSRSVSLLVVLLFLITISSAHATILRVDHCGGQFSRTQPVPLIKTQTEVLTVRGDLVDTITGVTAPPGVSVSIGGKTGGGGLNTSVDLTITPNQAAANGNQTIKLNYLAEFGQPDTFVINVRRFRVDTISQNPPGINQLLGSRVTITVTGIGLAGARLDPGLQNGFFTEFFSGPTSDTTFTFGGRVRNNALFRSNSFFDSNITGQGVDDSCARASGNAVTNYFVGLPDLVVSKATPVYRLQAAEGVPVAHLHSRTPSSAYHPYHHRQCRCLPQPTLMLNRSATSAVFTMSLETPAISRSQRRSGSS